MSYHFVHDPFMPGTFVYGDPVVINRQVIYDPEQNQATDIVKPFDEKEGEVLCINIPLKDFPNWRLLGKSNLRLEFLEKNAEIEKYAGFRFHIHYTNDHKSICVYHPYQSGYDQPQYMRVVAYNSNVPGKFPGENILDKLFVGNILTPRKFCFSNTGSISGEGSQPDTVHINLDSQGTSSPMNFTTSDHRRSIIDRRYVEKSTPMSSLIPLNVRYQGKDFTIDHLINDHSMQKVPLQDHVIAVDAKIIRDKLIVVGCKVPTGHATYNNIKVVMQGIFQPVNLSELKPIEKPGSPSRYAVSMN